MSRERGAAADGLAAVFLDGEYEDGAFYAGWARAADVVVAADGGGRFLAGVGVVPDIVVGDFDSLDPASLETLALGGARVVRHPTRKDMTDGELAADEALACRPGEVVLAGALGALDHVLGHLALLGRIEAGGIPARLVAPSLTVRVLVAPATVRLSAAPGTRVSLAPLGGDALVSLAGLDYGLDRGRLPADACLGLGNTVVAHPWIEVHDGRVAVLVFAGDEDFRVLRGRGGSGVPG